MSKDIIEYTNKITATLKNVARDNAVRDGSNDEGFNVRITKEDIKCGTDRKRIKEAVITKVVDSLNSCGFKAEQNEVDISVYVPPILGKKDIYTLEEIIERESVVKEINTYEEYKLMNE